MSHVARDVSRLFVKSLDGYKFYISTNSTKKYMTNIDGKWVHFGSNIHGQYKDKIGMYSALDNNDDKKRENYKNNNLRSKLLVKNSPAYFSWNYLW